MPSTCSCVVYLDNQTSVLHSRVFVDVCTPIGSSPLCLYSYCSQPHSGYDSFVRYLRFSNDVFGGL